MLIWAISVWPAGRGVVTALFLLLYAGLRFAVDLLRDYEAAWLGLGTGQVFNLAMAGVGLLLLIWFLSRPRVVPAPRAIPRARASAWQVIILIFLVLYPLGIPTSWTRENIIEKRQEELSDA